VRARYCIVASPRRKKLESRVTSRKNDGGKPQRIHTAPKSQRDILPRAVRHPRRGRSQPRVPRADSSRVVPARLSGMHVTSKSLEGESAKRDELHPRLSVTERISRRALAARSRKQPAQGGFLVSACKKSDNSSFGILVFKSTCSETSERLMDGRVRGDGMPVR